VTIYVKVGTIAWVHKISNTIEFCVEVDALDLLFNMLMDFFVDHGSKENMAFFVQSLEPYILSGRIKRIPDFAVGKLMAFYLRSEAEDTIGRILLNLDPGTIVAEQVLPIIKEYKLLTAGAFVCANNGDFVAPARMMMAAFLEEKDELRRMHYCYKLLWYLRMSFRGEVFLSGRLGREALTGVVSALGQWMEREEGLGALMRADVVCLLKVLWEAAEGGGLEDGAGLLSALQSAAGDETYLQLQVACFVCKVSQAKLYRIPYTVAVATSAALLQVRTNIENNPIGGSTIEAYIHNFVFGEKNRLAFLELNLAEISTHVLRILKDCENLQQSDQNLLLDYAQNPEHCLIRVFLYDLQEESIKALDTFLNSYDSSIKLQIFEWLDRKFSQSEQQELKSEVLKVFSILVEIDSDRTAQLVKNWFESSQSYIIKQLDKAPELQLKYLGELIKDQFDKDLLLRYVRLLCSHSRPQLMKFLKSCEIEYIEECLKICQEHKVVDAEAFLHEKLGAVNEALDLWKSVIQESKADLMRKIYKKEQIQGQSFVELGKRIQKYGKVCIRNDSALDRSELEEFWFAIFRECLDTFVDFKDFFYLYPQLEPVLHSSISFVLTHMLEHVELASILTCISTEYDEFPFKHIRNNIVQVLERFSYQRVIKQQALKLVKEDTATNVSLLYSSRLEGHASDFFLCRNCGKKVSHNSGSVYIFACGHVFHRRCQEIPACLICTYGPFPRWYFY
jgi:vacuolar protein sorting-associated protein 8